MRNDKSSFLQVYQPRFVKAALTTKATDLQYPNSKIFKNAGHVFFSYMDSLTGFTILFGPFTHKTPWVYGPDITNKFFLFPVHFFSKTDFAGSLQDQFYFKRKWIVQENLTTMVEDSLTKNANQVIVAQAPQLFFELVFDQKLGVWFDLGYDSRGPSPRVIDPRITTPSSSRVQEEFLKLDKLRFINPKLHNFHIYIQSYEGYLNDTFVKMPLVTMHLDHPVANKITTATFIDES